MAEDKKEQQIDIELDATLASGSYSNLAIINHSPSEFVVDFVSLMPGAPKAKVQSRIILTPERAKRFQKALAENLQKYQAKHGEIDTHDPPPIPMNFGPAGEA